MDTGRFSFTRRIGQLAAVAGLAALLLAVLGQNAGAQGTDGPPHWFWGLGYDADNGAVVRFVNEADGEEVARTVISGGTWDFLPHQSDAASGWIEIVDESGTRRTEVFSLRQGSFTPVERGQFTWVVPSEPEPSPAAADTDGDESGSEEAMLMISSAGARIVARVSDNPGHEGQLEFGMQVEGLTDVITPQRRYFPNSLPDSHIGRWLRSTEIELGNGVSGRVIARRLADGRTEFAFDATDGGDCVPSQRYFPAEGSARYPDHSGWLHSPVLNIPTDCTQQRGS